jgi:hypothetical protein
MQSVSKVGIGHSQDTEANRSRASQLTRKFGMEAAGNVRYRKVDLPHPRKSVRPVPGPSTIMQPVVRPK